MNKINANLIFFRINHFHDCYFSIILLLAPFPFFIDLNTLEPFLTQPKNINDMFSVHLAIPIPLSLICFITYQVYGFVALKNGSNKFKYLLSHRMGNNLITFFLGVYFVIFSMPIPKIFQIIIPIFLLNNIVIPVDKKNIAVAINAYCLGIFLFCGLHLVSIYINNKYSFLGVDRYLNFGTIFNYQIYQSIVTYVDVVALFSLLFIFTSLISKTYSQILIRLFIFISLIVLAGFGGSRMVLADLIIVLSIALFWTYKFVPRVLYWFSLASMSMLLLVINPFVESLHKINVQGTENRTILIYTGLEEIYDNLDNFLFFGDGSLTYLAHNFFINLLHGVGLFPTLIIVIMIFNTSLNIVRKSKNAIVRAFTIGALVMLLVNSTFNSAFTQPLYTSNLLIIIMLIFSVDYHLSSDNNVDLVTHTKG